MKPADVFLKIARDEAQTLVDYREMVDGLELDENQKEIVDEIMMDEMNHCLIALLTASQILGIKIGSDHIEPDPNTLEVTTEEGGE